MADTSPGMALAGCATGMAGAAAVAAGFAGAAGPIAAAAISVVAASAGTAGIAVASGITGSATATGAIGGAGVADGTEPAAFGSTMVGTGGSTNKAVGSAAPPASWSVSSLPASLGLAGASTSEVAWRGSAAATVVSRGRSIAAEACALGAGPMRSSRRAGAGADDSGRAESSMASNAPSGRSVYTGPRRVVVSGRKGEMDGDATLGNDTPLGKWPSARPCFARAGPARALQQIKSY